MAKHIQQGKKAELLACLFLQRNGYAIRDKNYRNGKAEVDIVAQKSKLIIFIEVKSLRKTPFGFPEESVGGKKKRLFHQAATSFQEEEKWHHEIRFDTIAITFLPQAVKIEHFEDAFS